MGLFNATYSADPLDFDIDGAKAGGAAAMETKLQGVIDAAASPSTVGDLVLAAVGEGPEWEATLVLAASVLPGVPRPSARVYATVAGNKKEAYDKLQARLVEATASGRIGAVYKLEVKGGGDGSNFMALALVEQPPE